MGQKVLVGLTKESRGWARILGQEGIAFAEASLSKKTEKESFAVIVANSRLSKPRLESLLGFLRSGGAVIAVPDHCRQVMPGICFEKRRLNPIVPSGSFFQGCGLLWLEQRIAAFPGIEAGQPLKMRIGKGSLLVLPFDPDKAVLNQSYEKRAFFSAKASPAEFAPKASKATARSFVRNCLVFLFDERKIPFLQLWYYPKDFLSAFCFHVDLDFIDSDTLAAIGLFKGLSIEPVWFLNMQAAEKVGAKPAVNAALRQRFVGQHGFLHEFWDEEEKSEQNVLQGHEKLASLGITAECFSSPNGVWSKGIAKALDKKGYNFAISFSLDNDNLPFYPVLGNRQAKTLFIPTHPVCIALLKQYDFGEEDLARYFASVIERNEKANLPIMLYSHPFKEIARFPKVVERTVEAAGKKPGIWVTNYFEFAAWWKARQKSVFSAEFDGKEVLLKAKCPKDASFRLVKRGKQFFFPAKTQPIKISGLGNGKPVFKGLVQDTAKRASLPGKKHLAKKAAGNCLDLLKSVKQSLSKPTAKQGEGSSMLLAKRFLAKALPRQAKDSLKYVLRTPKRISVLKQKASGEVVAKQDIINGLRSFGIKEGDTVMAHSSLSSFGYVEGGPKTVIDALLELVGPNGNVCMPCFGPLEDGKTFDSRKTRSGLGKISDVFWRLPGAKRSLSPTHNVACIGKDAEYICRGHHLDKTPFAKNSPYYKMLEFDAWVIALGSYIGKITIYHVIEDRLGEKFPVKTYFKDPGEYNVIDSNGKKHEIKAFAHDTALNPRRIDNNLNVGRRLKQFLSKAGCLKTKKIGKAEVLAMKAKPLMDCLAKMLSQGKTIYATDEEM